MGKTYKVVFNADLTGGASNSNQRFFYDWSKLEQGQYKCSFTWLSGLNGTPAFGNTPGIFIDLGQSNTYIATPITSRTTSWNPTFIGCLNQNVLTGTISSSYLFADLDTNPPVYLQQRPTNNTMTVLIQNLIAVPTTYANFNVGRYTFTLYLEKMD